MESLPVGMHIYYAVVSFVFGCIFGSFFNVCIYRIPARKSIIRPGSHCYSCGSPIRWYDNIPIVSYLLLRGNCRDCGTHFSPRYLGVELLTGLIFLAIYLKSGAPNAAVFFHCAFASFLIVGTFTDIDYFIIPDGVTKGGLVFGLLAALLLGGHSIIADQYVLARDMYTSLIADRARIVVDVPRWLVLGWAVAGAAFGWLMLAAIGLLGRILFRKEAMGGGDVKLFAFLGAYLGPVNCIWILFLSAVLGSCIGLTLILLHKLMRNDEFEEIELLPDRIVKSHLRAADTQLGARGERDTMIIGHTLSGAAALADLSPEPAVPDATAQEAKPLILRIARSTARQLHHFPFGPYIAVAALLIMLFHQEVDQITRNALFLPAPLELVDGAARTGGF